MPISSISLRAAATHISSVDHLAGRFNAHLRDACLLFADEAYWPGDRSDEGTLKRLITEPTLFIEAKGRDGVTVLEQRPQPLYLLKNENCERRSATRYDP